MASASNLESQRILEEYDRRERALGEEFYALHRPGNLFVRHGQERALLRALSRAACLPLANKRILEIGCGRGQWFVTYECLCAKRHSLAGIDLEAQRAAECAQRFAGADIRVGDATKLPWEDRSFDIVFQSTVFTSVLDAAVKPALAAEMLRVVKDTGAILWYDFRYNNPRNPHVRGIRHSEIKRLFPGCEIWLRRATLAPPLARRLVPWSWTFAALVEATQLLNTHLVGYIKKRG